MKFQLRDYQQKASNAAISHYRLKGGKNYLMVLPTGCHAKGTKILMYDGSMKNVEDIKVGDCLVGDDGKNVLCLSFIEVLTNFMRLSQ